MDGSKHLIYDKVESGHSTHGAVEKTGCFYADAKTLVNIEHADARKLSGPRGLGYSLTRDRPDPLGQTA